MVIYPEDILKLLLALALGGILGTERELRDKSAGLRTLMFICAGAALFTIFSVRLAVSAGAASDATRIASQIVSGIGFLGAGAIIRDRGEIRGLTTASMIWIVAALGVGIGSGLYLYATLATAVILLTLVVFPYVEMMMGKVRQVYTYEVVVPASHDKYEALCDAFRMSGLHVYISKRTRQGNDMVCTWIASGRKENHKKMNDLLFDDPEVKSFQM